MHSKNLIATAKRLSLLIKQSQQSIPNATSEAMKALWNAWNCLNKLVTLASTNPNNVKPADLKHMKDFNNSCNQMLRPYFVKKQTVPVTVPNNWGAAFRQLIPTVNKWCSEPDTELLFKGENQIGDYNSKIQDMGELFVKSVNELNSTGVAV